MSKYFPEVGDVVTLKSGSFPMTVYKLDNEHIGFVFVTSGMLGSGDLEEITLPLDVGYACEPYIEAIDEDEDEDEDEE